MTELQPVGEARETGVGNPAGGLFRGSYLAVFLILFGVLSLFAWDRVFRQSDHPHFVYLADSLLHGRLDIPDPPRWKDDYVFRDGKWWVTFPPLPAVLMLPFVKVWGLAFNDTLFTLLLAALNGVLVLMILERFSRRRLSLRTPVENLWLMALFCLGTVNFYCSILGQVWFTAQVVGVTLVCLFVLASIDARHPELAGFFLALGFLSRTPLLFAFPFFLYFVLYQDGVFRGWGRIGEMFRLCLRFAWPVACVLGVTFVYNAVRFGSIFEFGHGFILEERHKLYGMFSYAWLSRNLSAALTVLPRISDRFPFIQFSYHGTSVLVTTPALILLLWPRRTGSLHAWLWIAVAAVSLPTFLYKSTGYGQFGYRYLLDFAPFLLLLLAVGGRPLDRRFKALIIASIVVNAFGAIVFRRFDMFFHYDLFPEIPVR